MYRQLNDYECAVLENAAYRSKMYWFGINEDGTRLIDPENGGRESDLYDGLRDFAEGIIVENIEDDERMRFFDKERDIAFLETLVWYFCGNTNTIYKVVFENRPYPLREVFLHDDDSDMLVCVGTELLETALEKRGFEDEDVKSIDEGIFGYIPTKLLLHGSDAEVTDFIKTNLL